MFKKVFILLLLVLFSLNACKVENLTEPNLPSWSLDLEFPLIKESITLKELMSDSLFSTSAYGSDGDSIYTFAESMDIPMIEVGDQFTIPDIQQSLSSKIGPISIDDFGPTDTGVFDFQSLAPNLYSSMETLINMNGGSYKFDSIPEISLSPVTAPFSFSSFGSATFSSGTIDVTVHNDLFIPLGNPIDIDLLDSGDNTIASVNFINKIPAGASATESFDLSGLTLPGDVTIEVSGKTVGTEGDTITVTSEDLNSGFYVSLKSQNLVASSAETQLPGQTISQSDTIEIDASGNTIEYAMIKTGSLIFDIDNQMPLNSTMELSIPNLIDNAGNPFNTSFNIQADSPTYQSTDLTGWKMQITSSDQEIGYSYVVQTESTGSNTVIIDQDDSVSVEMELTGLSMGEIYGEISPLTMELDPVEQEFSALPEEFKGIEFSSVDMSIDFDTNIGIPILLNLDVKASNELGDSASISISDWNIIDSSTVVIPNAEELINIGPNALLASGNVTIGGTGSIQTTQYVSGQINISAPLEFTFTDDASIDIEPTSIDQDFPENIEGIILFAQIDNKFEFGAQVEVLASNSGNNFDRTPMINVDTLAILDIAPAQTDLDSVALDSSEIALFQQDSLYIATNVSVLANTDENGDPSPTRFLSTDSLEVLLYGKVRYLNDHLVSDKE